MLASPLAEALGRVRSVPKTRPLTREELETLRMQGNLVAGAELEAGDGFDPSFFHFNRFAGRVVLAGQVYHSVLEDVRLGDGCLIDHCPSVRRVIFGRGVKLLHSTVDCTAPTTFGVGSVIKGGLETPG